MRSRVVSKKLEVINGNLLFQFEILVPASDKMAKSKAFDRFEDTVEVAELSLSMEHVSDIIFPYPKESLGAVAVMIFLTDFGVSRMQNFFRSLNAPAYIWNDASYKAFTFEIPYNFFQDYERIMMFMRVCNGWAALLPTISGAICGE
uniref:SERPIN domain-containing protein n=1 Tax=Panagrellus redivivus TaxID=6233 RepID=A0A7E4UQN9_PANRE